MKNLLMALLSVSVIGVYADTLTADVMLFARYDWQQGATDVSASPLKHDGTLDPQAYTEGGRLVVERWDGVELGYMPELDGATVVLLRFEDVTLPDGGNYGVLAGGGYDAWWVGISYRQDSASTQTILTFNVGGWTTWEHPAYETQVVVAHEPLTHFESIEYRFDGSAPSDERCAIRWNDGAWHTGGWADADDYRTFPAHGSVRINDGARADWDPLSGTLGSVSFFSDQPPPSGTQRPGDCNGDQTLDIADAICLLGHLFLGSPSVLPCGSGTVDEPGNTALLDSNGDSTVDLADAVYVLQHLFLGGAPPVLGTECVSIAGCPSNCEGG